MKNLFVELCILGCVTVACTLTATYLLVAKDSDSLIYYGDAVSHLVISRSVYDSVNPGIFQLGSVYMPMIHLLLSPLATIDFMFHTGFAGTIVSSLSAGIVSLTLFRIARVQFKSLIAGILAGSLYVLNPSVLYMATLPMTEIPFTMFLVLCVYYFQKWYYNSYIENQRFGNQFVVSNNVRDLTSKQYFTLLKCGLAAAAASVTRYEGWLLVVVVIFMFLFINIVLDRKKPNRIFINKNRLKKTLPIIVSSTFAGFMCWIIYNVIYFRDPLYFLIGPYSIPIRSSLRPFREYLRMQPLPSLSIVVEVMNSMYGSLTLFLAGTGIIAYGFTTLRKKNIRIFMVFLATIVLLSIPTAFDLLAMILGFGEIYPSHIGYLNARYLTLIAPLLAFGAVAFLITITDVLTTHFERKDQNLNRAVVVVLRVSCVMVVITAYCNNFILQPLEVGKTSTMSEDYTMLPFLKHYQYAFLTGNEIGKLIERDSAKFGLNYNDDDIKNQNSGERRVVLFVPSQSGQQIILKSGLPIRTFVDPTSGSYWKTTKESPWVVGTYLIIRKPIDIHPDPINSVIEYWLNREQILLKHYDQIYQNEYYKMYRLTSKE